MSAISPHPFKNLFATAGSDQSVRVWGADERACLAIGMPQITDPETQRLSVIEWAPKVLLEHHIASGLTDGSVAIMVYNEGKQILASMNVDISGMPST